MCKHCPPKPKAFDLGDIVLAMFMASLLVICIARGIVLWAQTAPPTVQLDARIEEDMPGWDCHTMGNFRCTP